MATKSFQTDFKFTSKSGHALAEAIRYSRRVDIKVDEPVKIYSDVNSDQFHKKFDKLFNMTIKGVKISICKKAHPELNLSGLMTYFI